MRLGVLDVGSNTVHLLVVDAHLGAQPTPQLSHKSVLRLAELVDRRGDLAREGGDALVGAVLGARRQARDAGCDEVLAFATSAVRDAKNSAQVLARVREDTGTELRVLTGEDEARLTFLAVLVRVERRSAAVPRHRRRLAGAGHRAGRGTRARDLRAARRRTTDPGTSRR